MNLRPYQERAVASATAALREHPSTLLVAPTGAGKTVLMAAVAREYGGRVLVLQHRDELVRQNLEKFRRLNRGWSLATFDRNGKRFARPSGCDGAATFAMVPTLSRPKSLERIPELDLIMVDECHHVLAPTWRSILNRAREVNPEVRIFGVTATPERSDNKGLGDVFDTCCEVISIGELIAGGYLVTPVLAEAGVDLGLQGVKRLNGGRGDFDMDEVARLVDQPGVTDTVIQRWRESAGDRRTVVFCANVAHARHVCFAFQNAGIKAGLVLGSESQPPEERAEVLRRLERGELQVIVNVYALTEGFDHQPISCVVILRPTCFRSVVKQMLGRGLRIVDPEHYPNLPPKVDCVVLDFGRSLTNMGGLDTIFALHKTTEREPGVAPMKPCPECHAAIPLSARECPLCGYEYPPPERADIDPSTITMRPVELILKDSLFEWFQLNSRTRIACSERTWSIVFSDLSGTWHAFGAADTGGSQRPRAKHLASGTLNIAIARGDDFMNEFGDPKRHGRRSSYLRLPPTDAQIQFAKMLLSSGKIRSDFASFGRYQLSCLITASVQRDTIKRLLTKVAA